MLIIIILHKINVFFQCSAVIEENYARIYQFLTSELKGKVLCTIVGICPKSQNSNIHYMAVSY